MDRTATITALLLVLAACQQEPNNPTLTPESEVVTVGAPPPRAVPTDRAEPRWVTLGGSEGAHARLTAPDGTLIMSVGCRIGSGRIDIVVPGFERIGSEDRLSFGFDDDPMALVVDLSASEPGIHASGPVPADIGPQMLSAGAVRVSYGQQNLGPFAAPTGHDAQSLAIACRRQRG